MLQELLRREALFKYILYWCRYEYQLQRYILGVSKLCEKQLLPNQYASQIVKTLPNAVFKLGADRVAQAQPNTQTQIDAEEEAEEDLMADNTHLGVLPRN